MSTTQTISSDSIILQVNAGTIMSGANITIESSNSNEADITPSFVAARYAKPVWVVKVNGSPVADAILEKVEKGFGSDMSNATFTLARDPRSGGNPVEDDAVEVIVNGVTVFTGEIRVKTDHIARDGMKITYTALSTLSELNYTTVINGSFNEQGSDFPNQLFGAFEVAALCGIPITGIPDAYPGGVNVTDQPLLQAAESILAKIGNYKVYGENGAREVYTLQSGGTNTRSFIIGGNVIAYNINTSDENVVDKVIVIGPRIQVTKRVPVDSTDITIDKAGRRFVTFRLGGFNVRNIQVEGLTREKPKIEFDGHTFVNKAMLQFSDFSFDSGNFQTESFPINDTTGLQNPDFKLKPLILSQQHNQAEWTQIGSSVEYPIGPLGQNQNTCTVFLTEVPKIWYPITVSGTVLNSALGLDGDGTTWCEILDEPEYNYSIGSLRVTYTVDTTKPSVSVGGGSIVRTITDSQYQIESDQVNNFSNEAHILLSMQIRAQAEFERTNTPVISGNITVYGDETIDLKHTVLIEGEKLDILHITHNFTNGFTTEITVTNERARNTINLRPFIARRHQTEEERRHTIFIESTDAEVFRQRNAAAASEKKDDPDSQSSGPYAVYHP